MVRKPVTSKNARNRLKSQTHNQRVTPGVCRTERTLTNSPCRRRNWLSKSVHATSGDVQSQTSPKPLARLLRPWNSNQWKTDMESASCLPTGRIWPLTLIRSFASGRIIPVGKLGTTNPSNAGHLYSANNPLCITNTQPAERRVLLCRKYPKR